MKHLKNSDLKYVGGGAFGTYYQLKSNPALGIKIIHSTRDAWGYCTKSVKKCFNKNKVNKTDSYKFALKELNFLRKIKKLVPLAPTPHELAVVEYKQRGQKPTYVVGYIMEHIDGKLLGNEGKMSWYERQYKVYQLKYKLEKLGINHQDLHQENIIVSRIGKSNVLRPIDWAPKFVKVKRTAKPKAKKKVRRR